MMAKDEQTVALLECSEKQKEKYKEQAQKCSAPFLYTTLKLLNQCDINYRQSSNKRLLVELTLIQVAQITQPADKDVPAAGRQPNRLKSLFKNLMLSQPKTATQVAGAEKPLSHVHHEVPSGTMQQGGVATSTTMAAATEKTQVKPVGGLNGKVKLGSVGFTFNNILKMSKEKNDVVQTDAQTSATVADDGQDMQFSQEELELQWMSMCTRMPKQYVGMAARMKNMIPKITDFPNIELVVDNDILLNEIQQIKKRILSTLIQTLHNNRLDINIRLAKVEEVGKILTKKELFDQMKEKNPAIKRLSDNFGLVLG
jgi:DNA polymerase-3 subunit gamma/tau